MVIQFQVDKTAAEQLLPYHLLTQDAPLVITIEDGKPAIKDVTGKTDEDVRREKLYARIEIQAKEAGLTTEEKKRAFYEAITGERSKKNMTIDDLESLENALYKEANPISEES